MLKKNVSQLIVAVFSMQWCMQGNPYNPCSGGRLGRELIQPRRRVLCSPAGGILGSSLRRFYCADNAVVGFPVVECVAGQRASLLLGRVRGCK